MNDLAHFYGRKSTETCLGRGKMMEKQVTKAVIVTQRVLAVQIAMMKKMKKVLIIPRKMSLEILQYFG